MEVVLEAPQLIELGAEVLALLAEALLVFAHNLDFLEFDDGHVNACFDGGGGVPHVVDDHTQEEFLSY